jgi:nucleotide-binding universal stress UspA family protein
MPLRDILVHVDPSESGKTRLRLGAGLAARHAARLTALYVREYSIEQQRRLRVSELGLVPGKHADLLARHVEHELDADAYALRELLVQLQQVHAIDAIWRAADGQAKRIVPQHSRYADLTIVGHDTSVNTDLPDGYSFAEAMLFTSGRPLLIVPSGERLISDDATLGRRIAVAWNSSRASARALSDALPLIEQAERTTVLFVDAAEPARPDQLPTTNVIDHLRLHCRNVHGHAQPVTNRPIGELLQTVALEEGADLLVAGAHGRAGLWEKLLGRVTRDLLARMRLPLLMSY